VSYNDIAVLGRLYHEVSEEGSASADSRQTVVFLCCVHAGKSAAHVDCCEIFSRIFFFGVRVPFSALDDEGLIICVIFDHCRTMVRGTSEMSKSVRSLVR